jgi:hypothetical protein
MSDLLTEPRRTPASRPSAPVAVLFVVAIAAAVVFAIEVAPAPARFVSGISITNPLPYQVATEVSGPDRNGWMALGAVDPGRSQSFGEVFDLGANWVFRYSYAGVPGGEVRAARSELTRARWRVAVPPEVGQRFEAATLAPSAGAR